MTAKELPNFDSEEEPESPDRLLADQNASTETIDLNTLFSTDPSLSGSFDLSTVGSTSFGRLLDALPMPAILVDQWHLIGFANLSCSRLGPDSRKLRGIRFLDLVPRPTDRERARVLTGKTETLLEQVFQTRKPRVAEAILEVQGNRIWVRLHLRAVRIGGDRNLLILIEDLTQDKKQLELNRRQEKEYRKLHDDLEKRLQASNSELQTTAESLRREMAARRKGERDLRAEKQKFKILIEQVPVATALVAPTGTFVRASRHFTRMFGHCAEDLPNLRDWTADVQSDGIATEQALQSDWLDALNHSDDSQMAVAVATLTCKDETRKKVTMRGARLADGHYFVSFEALEECRREKNPT